MLTKIKSLKMYRISNGRLLDSNYCSVTGLNSKTAAEKRAYASFHLRSVLNLRQLKVAPKAILKKAGSNGLCTGCGPGCVRLTNGMSLFDIACCIMCDVQPGRVRAI